VLFKPLQKRIYKPHAGLGFVVVCLVSVVWYDHTVELKLNIKFSFSPLLSLLSPSSSCTGPTTLRNRQQVEQIKTDVYEQFFPSHFNGLLMFF